MLVDWDNGTDQQIAFGRGSVAFVAIDNDAQSWSYAFKMGLPAGDYCDVIHGSVISGSFSNAIYTISFDGVLDVTVSALDAIAVHTDALVNTTPT
ncbi:glycoside hydrolase family 13 protein [Athelia psychrophila]|uniref:Glycoside hydrolase family 13 protein n=1 Tax=Athelia psychrophila TaxID=1759441 RepID=A0A166D8Z9_9AGAM|nr:glycoside hydrolase family 13 protein [Fibularhizoctonia sp. CBS 109695]